MHVLHCGRPLPSVAQPVPAQSQKKCFQRCGQAAGALRSPGTSVLPQPSQLPGAPGAAHTLAWEAAGELVTSCARERLVPLCPISADAAAHIPLWGRRALSSDLRTLSLAWDSDVVVQDSRLQPWLPQRCCQRPACFDATTNVLSTKVEERVDRGWQGALCRADSRRTSPGGQQSWFLRWQRAVEAVTAATCHLRYTDRPRSA